MKVTFTNTTSSDIYLSAIYMNLPALSSITTRRSRAQLEAEQSLKTLVTAGSITLTFAVESGDSAQVGFGDPLLAFTTASRPAPSAVPIYTEIFNTDEATVEFSDSTEWRNQSGSEVLTLHDSAVLNDVMTVQPFFFMKLTPNDTAAVADSLVAAKL